MLERPDLHKKTGVVRAISALFFFLHGPTVDIPQHCHISP